MISRYLSDQIAADLAKKMVFMGGPRQVGKTTLAKQFLLDNHENGYLNWDIPERRAAILKRELPDTSLWVFDEIHEYSKWRNYLKGIYDQFSKSKQVLVTGRLLSTWWGFSTRALLLLTFAPAFGGRAGYRDSDRFSRFTTTWWFS